VAGYDRVDDSRGWLLGQHAANSAESRLTCRLVPRPRPNKLRASEQRIFEVVRAVVEHSGVLAANTRRALDSTVLDDAVQTKLS
jgi:hypothetical protein